MGETRLSSEGRLVCTPTFIVIMASSTISVGRLEKIDWTVKVGLASSAARQLQQETYVALALVVRDEAGKLAHKTMELSLPEFNALLAGLKDAQGAMQKL